MGWQLLEYERPTKEELKGILGRASFYADHNLDESIVYVLRHQKYDVVTAREIGAEQQPDEYHFRWSAQKGRVLLTQDKDFLDNGRFPLSQTHGVVVFNVNSASTSELARALEVVDAILGVLKPTLHQAKASLNSDYTLTMTSRRSDGSGFAEERTRYRLDKNGRDVWVWEDE